MNLRDESSVIVRFQLGTSAVLFAGTNTNPESKPLASGSHGAANDDWVTLWFPGVPAKTNVTTVPLGAVTLDGLKLNGLVAGPPTVI